MPALNISTQSIGNITPPSLTVLHNHSLSIYVSVPQSHSWHGLLLCTSQMIHLPMLLCSDVAVTDAITVVAVTVLPSLVPSLVLLLSSATAALLLLSTAATAAVNVTSPTPQPWNHCTILNPPPYTHTHHQLSSALVLVIFDIFIKIDLPTNMMIGLLHKKTPPPLVTPPPHTHPPARKSLYQSLSLSCCRHRHVVVVVKS